MRELVKDLQNIKGDLASGYKTIPIVKTEVYSKKILTLLTFLTAIPIIILLYNFNVGNMIVFFYAVLVLLVIFLILMWRWTNKIKYLALHNILKLIIVLGVFSIMLIDMDVIIKRIF